LIDDGRPATIANQWQRALGYGIRLRIDPHAEWLLPLDRYAAHPIFQPGIVHRGGLAIRARTVNWVRGFSGEAKGAAVATDDPFLPFFLPSFLPSIHPSIHPSRLADHQGGEEKKEKNPPRAQHRTQSQTVGWLATAINPSTSTTSADMDVFFSGVTETTRSVVGRIAIRFDCHHNNNCHSADAARAPGGRNRNPTELRSECSAGVPPSLPPLRGEQEFGSAERLSCSESTSRRGDRARRGGQLPAALLPKRVCLFSR